VKRTTWLIGGLVLLALILAGGAFAAGRLLGSGLNREAGGSSSMLTISTGDGQEVKAEWVPAPELPDDAPDVAGVFEGRRDNSIFVNETEGGFILSQGEDGSISVTNATGRISEVVVTGETAVHVDETNEKLDAALSGGKIYQKLGPGSVEEIGELSYVRAWGTKRGDRLIASVLLYNRPPVIGR
jgi:hypothetical protein